MMGSLGWRAAAQLAWFLLLGAAFGATGGPVPAETTGALKPFRRVRFSAEFADLTQAKCMDQKPAGYFLREGDPLRWVVWLQGGGLCVSPLDCPARLHGEHPNFGSFDPWDASYDRLDPFDEQSASVFAGYTQVWVPYCSSDTWLGTDRGPRALNGGYQMSGHLIIAAVVDHLLNATAFGHAREVALAGDSAGGIGAIQHSDVLEARLRSVTSAQAMRFSTFAVGGMFFPRGWPVLFEEFAIGVTKPVEDSLSKYVHMFEDGFVHEGCAQAARENGTSAGRCFDISEVLPYVKGRLFFVQNRFDELQIQLLGLCPPSVCFAGAEGSSLGGRFVRLAGQRMNDTLSSLASRRPGVGIFSPGALDHITLLKSYVGGKGDLRISGLTVAGAFGKWLDGGRVHLFEDCGSLGPCTAGPQTPPEFVV